MSGELTKWQSHKVVSAGKIVDVSKSQESTGGTIEKDGAVLRVENANGSENVYTCPAMMFARGVPLLGDYFVIYDDGYQSWSPAAIFEAGYTKQA